MITLGSSGSFILGRGQSLAVTQDSNTSLAAAQDSIGLRLADAEGMRDFLMEKELGKMDLLLLRQSRRVDPTVFTVCAGLWQQVRPGAVFCPGVSATIIQLQLSMPHHFLQRPRVTARN